jgi:serine/threonine protein kinase
MSVDEPLVKGRYRALARVGSGAYGAVFRGMDTDTGMTIAMKKMPLPEDRRKSAELIKQFDQEISIFRRLDHRCVIRYLDDAQSDTALYIIMEFAERQSLLHLLQRNHGGLPEEDAIPITRDIVSGLAYLHHQGVLHRDVKAANVLLSSDNTAKLSDFGLALINGPLGDLEAAQTPDARSRTTPPPAAATGQPTSSASIGEASGGSHSKGIAAPQQPQHAAAADNGKKGDLVGSVYWMAPEVIELQTPTKASDIWSLGCTVVELLTGKPPFYNRPTANAMYTIVQGKESPIPESLRHSASEPLLNFLELCFLRDSSARPQASELLQHPWLHSDSTAAIDNGCELDDSTALEKGPRKPTENGSHHHPGGNGDDASNPQILRGGGSGTTDELEDSSNQLMLTDGKLRSSNDLTNMGGAVGGSFDVHEDAQATSSLPLSKLAEKFLLNSKSSIREHWVVQQKGIERVVLGLSTAEAAQIAAVVKVFARYAKLISTQSKSTNGGQQTGPSGGSRASVGPGADLLTSQASIGSTSAFFTQGSSFEFPLGGSSPQSAGAGRRSSSAWTPLGAGNSSTTAPPPQLSPTVPTAFFQCLGETDFWSIDLWDAVDHKDLLTLFVRCCEHQQEGRCAHLAAGQGRTVALLLGESTAFRAAAIGALHQALTKSVLERERERLGGGTPTDGKRRQSLSGTGATYNISVSSAGSGDAAGDNDQPPTPFSPPSATPLPNSSCAEPGEADPNRTSPPKLVVPSSIILQDVCLSPKIMTFDARRPAIADAMLSGGVLSAVAKVVSEATDLKDDEMEASWSWIDQAFEIMLHATAGDDGLFLQLFSADMGITIINACRKHCTFGVAMFVRWLRADPDAALDIAGITPLLGAATDLALEYRTRVEVLRALSDLQQLPPKDQLLITADALPLLGHALAIPPPPREDDLVLQVFIELCQDREFAAAASMHSKFLRVLIDKMSLARQRSDSDLADVLLLTKLLFANTPRPDIFLTCAELISLVAKTSGETTRAADVRKEAQRLLEGFSAQTKMV